MDVSPAQIPVPGAADKQGLSFKITAAVPFGCVSVLIFWWFDWLGVL